MITISGDHCINIPKSNTRKVSTRLDPNSSNQSFFNTKFDELMITVFYPLLDKLLSGIDLRFKQDTFVLVDAMASMLNMDITLNQCWEGTRSFYRNEARNAFYLKYWNEERERVPIFKERERKFPFLK